MGETLPSNKPRTLFKQTFLILVHKAASVSSIKKQYLPEAQGVALVVPHKSAAGDFGAGAEAVPGPGKVIHPLQADPHGLGARLALGRSTYTPRGPD